MDTYLTGPRNFKRLKFFSALQPLFDKNLDVVVVRPPCRKNWGRGALMAF